jgi:pimeloyl-ACP methyl ester carboxylesterase
MRDMIGHNLQRWLCLAALLLLGVSAALAEEKPAKPPLPEEPFGIGLEGFPYPYPVRMFTLSEDGERLRMAYMDVRPKGEANGHTVLLLDGRNFPSSYWRPTIEALAGNGYRVVAPDQIGFGKSSKPLSDLHFDQLARNTIALLDEARPGACRQDEDCARGGVRRHRPPAPAGGRAAVQRDDATLSR